MALWAFGQRWGEPVTAKDNAAEFVAAPTCRRACRLRADFGRRCPHHSRRIGRLSGPADSLGQRRTTGGGGDSRLVRHMVQGGGPARDAAATGRGVRCRQLAAIGKAGALDSWRKSGWQGRWRPCQRLAMEHKTGVLVLEADWFGKLAATRTHKWVPAGYPEQPFAVAPKQLVGPLADWQRQQWALPPTFRRSALPWPGISNRQTWIAGAGYPRTFQGFRAEAKVNRDFKIPAEAKVRGLFGSRAEAKVRWSRRFAAPSGEPNRNGSCSAICPGRDLDARKSPTSSSCGS